MGASTYVRIISPPIACGEPQLNVGQNLTSPTVCFLGLSSVSAAAAAAADRILWAHIVRRAALDAAWVSSLKDPKTHVERRIPLLLSVLLLLCQLPNPAPLSSNKSRADMAELGI